MLHLDTLEVIPYGDMNGEVARSQQLIVVDILVAQVRRAVHDNLLEGLTRLSNSSAALTQSRSQWD
jgi:hypothetical protein